MEKAFQHTRKLKAISCHHLGSIEHSDSSFMYNELCLTKTVLLQAVGNITILVKSFAHLNGIFCLACLEEIGKLWKWWTITPPCSKLAPLEQGAHKKVKMCETFDQHCIVVTSHNIINMKKISWTSRLTRYQVNGIYLGLAKMKFEASQLLHIIFFCYNNDKYLRACFCGARLSFTVCSNRCSVDYLLYVGTINGSVA